MKNRKILALLIITLLILILAIAGATYAYFQGQIGNNQNVNLNVTTATTDSLIFEIGDEIRIDVNQTNFEKGMGNQSDETYAKTTLKANNATNSATVNYYVYLVIGKNELVYTTEEQTAELILTVTDPEGNAVTSIDGLNYVTVGNISGFDITTAKGLITIADNYEITSTGTNSQEWKMKVTFVNLDSDQNANTEKTFAAELKIQKEKITFLADYVKALYTTDGENGLYLHDADLENGAGDNSLRYSGADPDNYVCFGSDAETCPTDNLYRIIGVFDDQVKLIKSSIATSDLLGTDGDYYSSILYYWNKVNYSTAYNATGYFNVWSYSALNTINLNTNYLNNIGNDWASKITETKWQVGGGPAVGGVVYYPANAQTAASYEIGTNKIATYGTTSTVAGTYEAKIGLMYVSEYYYAASPNYWTYPGYTTSIYPDKDGNYGENYDYRAAKNENWMAIGVYEWTISRDSDTAYSAFLVSIYNHVYGYSVGDYNRIRPTFSLKAIVELTGGTGTASDPYRIN